MTAAVSKGHPPPPIAEDLLEQTDATDQHRKMGGQMHLPAHFFRNHTKSQTQKGPTGAGRAVEAQMPS